MTTEWNAEAYHAISSPQFAWGMKVLATIDLRGDEAALDAGCGTGRLTAELLARLPTGHVVAADRSSNMVEAARVHLRRFGDRARFHVGDLLDLPHRSAFDLIFSTATFHWILDHDRLFGTLFEVLRPGGRLVAQCGGEGNLASLHAHAEAVMRSPAFAADFVDWADVWAFESAEATAARLSRAGFSEIETNLETAPTPFPDRASFSTFLENVVLRNHLAKVQDPSRRRQFLDAVVDRSAAFCDYVRLNLRARRPEV